MGDPPATDRPATPPVSPGEYHRYEEPTVRYLILHVLGVTGLDPRPDQAVYATVKLNHTEARTRILLGANAAPSWREKFIFPVFQEDPETMERPVSTPDKSDRPPGGVAVIAVHQVQRGFADECLGRVHVSIPDVETLKATPTAVQSFLLEVKSKRDTIAGEVIQIAAKKDYTFGEISKMARERIATAFKPLPVRRKIQRIDDDEPLFPDDEAKEKLDPLACPKGDGDPVTRSPSKAEGLRGVDQGGTVKSTVEIQLKAFMLEEPEAGLEPLGTLRLRVIRATDLTPSNHANPYGIVHYGRHWVRLRTKRQTTDPVWDQTVTFPVTEIAHVLRVAVVYDRQCDSSFIKNSDVFLGKVRLRPSTLDVGKPYQCRFPLLRPGTKRGVHVHGHLELEVTLESDLTATGLFGRVVRPALPAAYYSSPDTLEMYQSAQRARMEHVLQLLAHAAPPIRREAAAQTMDEADPPFDLQRAKVNIERFKAVKAWVELQALKWDGICRWENPAASIGCQALWVFFVYREQFVAPCITLLLLGISLEYYLKRQTGDMQVPQSPDKVLSSKTASDAVDEPLKQTKDKDKDKDKDTDKEKEKEEKKAAKVEKEKDKKEGEEAWEDYILNPLTRWESQLDEAMAIVSAVQNAVGDVASFAERLAHLITWVDPRASTLFVAACCALTIVLAVVPIRLVLSLVGLFTMRPPALRDPCPPPPVNLFLRLPTRLDQVYDWVSLSTLKKGPQKGSKESTSARADEDRRTA